MLILPWTLPFSVAAFSSTSSSRCKAGLRFSPFARLWLNAQLPRLRIKKDLRLIFLAIAEALLVDNVFLGCPASLTEGWASQSRLLHKTEKSHTQNFLYGLLRKLMEGQRIEGKVYDQLRLTGPAEPGERPQTWESNEKDSI